MPEPDTDPAHDAERRPGAPPDREKRRVSDEPLRDQEGEELPIGNGGTNEPPAFPPHH